MNRPRSATSVSVPDSGSSLGARRPHPLSFRLAPRALDPGSPSPATPRRGWGQPLDLGLASPATVDDGPEHRKQRLGVLMRQHGAAVFTYCVRMMKDPALAEDVHQHVFEQAYRDLGALREEEQAKSWLFGIAHHRCLDRLKSERRWSSRVGGRDEDLAEVPSREVEPGEALDRQRTLEALDACVRSLPPEARTAVLLRFHQSLTYESMATTLREKAATLQARVTRALPALRRCLSAKGVAP